MAGSGVGASGGAPPQRRLTDAAGTNVDMDAAVDGSDVGGSSAAGTHALVGMFGAGFVSGLAIVAGFKAKTSSQAPAPAAGIDVEA